MFFAIWNLYINRISGTSYRNQLAVHNVTIKKKFILFPMVTLYLIINWYSYILALAKLNKEF